LRRSDHAREVRVYGQEATMPEAAVFMVKKPFSKKQSMQWTITGAHYLLQVRTRVLNGDLETEFRKWHPLFRTSASGIQEVTKLKNPQKLMLSGQPLKHNGSCRH
jgi:hypothetical protein